MIKIYSFWLLGTWLSMLSTGMSPTVSYECIILDYQLKIGDICVKICAIFSAETRVLHQIVTITNISNIGIISTNIIHTDSFEVKSPISVKTSVWHNSVAQQCCFGRQWALAMFFETLIFDKSVGLRETSTSWIGFEYERLKRPHCKYAWNIWWEVAETGTKSHKNNN